MMKRILFFCFFISYLLVCSCTKSPAKNDVSNSRIVFLSKVRNSDYWNVVKSGAEAAAKEYNISLELLSTDSENNVGDQIIQVEEALKRNTDALVLAPNDFYALAEVVEKAYSKKVPVIIIDSEINTDKYHCFIGTDNFEAGKEAGKELIKAIGPQGKLAIIGYIQDTGNERNRSRGLNYIFSQYPSLKISMAETLTNDSETAEHITEELLTEHPGLKGIVALNSPSGEGAAAVLHKLGLADTINLVTFDSTVKEIEMLEKGAINTTIVQNPFNMGYMAVRNAVSVLKGEEVPKKINTKITIINKYNMYNPENERLLFPFAR